MGIEQKLRDSLHRSAASLGEPTLRWDDVGVDPIVRSRSLARASFAAVLAFAIAIGSFVFLKDAFKSHPIPAAHKTSPVEARPLAARLGLSRYAVTPAG